MEKFRVRPAYKSEELLVEFWGDHRGSSFPNIQEILARELNAKPAKRPGIDTAAVAMATDEHISFWQYENGEYELDDDIWAYFIHAPVNNVQIISDIERALVASGCFTKEQADFSEYT